MPIQEYQCTKCGGIFEELLRSSTSVQQPEPSCPVCKTSEVRRLFPGTGKGLQHLRSQPSLQPTAGEVGSTEPPAVAQRTADETRPTQWQVREPTESSDAVAHEIADAVAGAAGWLLIAASRRGKLHAHEGKYREDAFALASHAGWNIAAVADGAGSAPLARVGARIATRTCVEMLTRCLYDLGAAEPSAELHDHIRGLMEIAVQEARQQLVVEAMNRGVTIRDMNTTLLAVAHRPYAGEHMLYTAQVGDGLICAWSPTKGVQLLAKPDYGEFANETLFLTQAAKRPDVEQRVSEERELPSDLQYLVLMTDGVADDFLPATQALPKLLDHLPSVLAEAPDTAKGRLLDLIGYAKRGSFDDRTIAVIASHPDPAVVG